MVVFIPGWTIGPLPWFPDAVQPTRRAYHGTYFLGLVFTVMNLEHHNPERYGDRTSGNAA